MNPYFVALLASLCFGVVVFPWQATLRLVGFGGFMLITGLVYALTGIAAYYWSGSPGPLTARGVTVGLTTAMLYTGALLLCSYVFSRPGINISVAAAITAAYPMWTALIVMLVFRQKPTVTEAVFLLMVLVGVVGLGLTSKPLPQVAH